MVVTKLRPALLGASICGRTISDDVGRRAATGRHLPTMCSVIVGHRIDVGGIAEPTIETLELETSW